jgi:outer membrane immunogenic protein
MLKSIACAFGALTALSSLACASDLPSKKSAPLAPQASHPSPVVSNPFSWDGFYVGLHAGYGFGDVSGQEQGSALPLESYSLSPKGFAGGVHGGYNMTFMNSYLAGLELSVDDVALTDSATTGAISTNVDYKNSYRASLVGRIGYIIDDFLIYGLGGGAYNHANENYTSGGASSSIDNNRIGWTLGAGLEYAINQNWIARGEYRYSDFGSVSTTPAVGAFPSPNTVDFKQHDQVISLGLSYKFDSSSALLARY